MRAAERLKQQSASTIQRYFRGYTCRKSIFLQLRIDFDKQLSDVNKVRAVYDRLKKNATDEFNIPWNNMKILLRSVSFLITHSSAVESITDVMGLQTGSNRISESLNIIGNAVSYLMRNKNVDSVVWRYVSVVLEHGISSTSTSMAKGFVNSKTAGTICKALSLIGQELLLGNHPTVLLDLAHTNYLTICELLQQALQYKIHQMALLHCMAKESEDFMELVDEDESCVHKKARSSIVDANANEYDNSGDNSINVIIEELCTFITTYISVYESQQHLNTKTNSRSNERMSVILYGLIHHVVSIPNISKIFVDMSTHYTVETVACLNALKGLCGICSRKSASNVVCRNTLYAYCDARYMLNESSTDCDKVTKVLHVLCNMLLMSSPKSETDVISPLCVADLGYSENSHFWSLLYKVVCGSMTARVPIFSLITKKMSTAHEPRTGRLGYGAHALTKYDSPHSDGIALLEVLIDVQQEAVVSSQNSSNLLGGGLFQKPFKLPSHNKSWEERALDEYDTVSHVLYSLFGDSSNVDEIVTQAVDGILKAKSMKTDPTVSDLSTSQGSSIIVDTLLEQYHTILCIYTCILIPMLKMPAPKGGTSSSEVNSARAPELFVLGNQMLNRLSFSSRNDCTL